MSLIIATGSNQGDSVEQLTKARELLSQKLTLVAESRIYRSKAVDYEAQPDFFNQVLEFQIPTMTPPEAMDLLLNTETIMGRKRIISRGPRIIDLDLIFWDLLAIDSIDLIVPHPRWNQRSFVIKPLRELPFFQTIEKCFTIPRDFKTDAFPI